MSTWSVRIFTAFGSTSCRSKGKIFISNYNRTSCKLPLHWCEKLKVNVNGELKCCTGGDGITFPGNQLTQFMAGARN